MARKRSGGKVSAKAAPRPEQLKAVERLLDAGAYREAEERLRGLIRRFPGHGSLRGLLVDALALDEQEAAAALAAFTWAWERPNSLPAQQALLDFASAQGHLLLASRTAGRVRELGGDTPGFPMPEETVRAICTQPDGSRVDEEVLLRFDIGKLHLEGQDFAGAAEWLAGVELSHARNNHALALFHLGRVDEAREAFLEAWARSPENLFALAWSLRLRLLGGDEAGAEALAVTLAEALPSRLDDALPQLESLLLLGWNEAAWGRFEAVTRAEWFASTPDQSPFAGLFHHYGAGAAARLGRIALALRGWEAALELAPQFEVATANLRHFERGGGGAVEPELFSLAPLLPLGWLEAARRDGGTVSHITAPNRYLDRIYRAGDEQVRMLAVLCLEVRAGEEGDGEALALLREYPRLAVGNNRERLEIVNFLRRRGFVPEEEPVEFWDGRRVTSVRLFGGLIHREAVPSGLSKGGHRRLGEALEDFREGRAAEAEVILREILRGHPGNPVVMGNLAAAYFKLDRDEEAVALLAEVVERHPDYLFARSNLAKVRIDEGRIEEAERLLGEVAPRERMHVQEAFAFFGALAALHHARGREEEVDSLLAMLEAMVEDEDDERRLREVKRMVGRGGMADWFARHRGA
ncbi:tetratricopeptide repeat protein [Endothiovibrio diazotrophicus]